MFLQPGIRLLPAIVSSVLTASNLILAPPTDCFAPRLICLRLIFLPPLFCFHTILAETGCTISLTVIKNPLYEVVTYRCIRQIDSRSLFYPGRRYSACPIDRQRGWST